MDTLVRNAANASRQPAPALAPAKATADDDKKKRPHRMVDVAQFHNLPLAGSPTVSAAEDPTLVAMDPVNTALTKLESKGKIFAAGIKGYRVSTDVVGPAAWGLSSILMIKLYFKTLKDPTIAASSKVALGVATLANTVGSVFAMLSSRFVGPLLKLSTAGRMSMNKLSGIIGGIGGNIFNVINLIETLRNKDATPSQRFFAKLGFVLGMTGFIFGTIAMTASMPALAGVFARASWLLPVATKIANTVGVVGMFAWLGQLFLGKNKWLNQHVKGTFAG